MRITRALGLFIALLAVHGCAKAPATLTLRGATLKKAQESKLAAGPRLVAYTPDGAESGVNDADKKLNVYTAAGTPDALEKLLLDAFTTRLTLERWLVAPSEQGTSACMVARNTQNGRFMVSTMSCASRKNGAACAVFDEGMPVPCNTADADCKAMKAKELCAAATTADLDAAAATVLR
jgi:hypothetical protein